MLAAMAALALLLGWSAINVYAAGFHGALYVHGGRRAPEHVAFMLLAVGHVGYGLSLAAALVAETSAEAARVASVELAFGLGLAAALGQFAAAISGHGRFSRAVPAAWVSMGVGAVASLAGLCTATLREGTTRVAGFGFDAPRLEAGLTPVGLFFVAVAIGWCVAAMIVLLRGARDPAEARILAGVATPALAVVAYYEWSRSESAHGWLVEIAAAAPIALAAGIVLLRRFARAASDLEARTHALERSYQELGRTQDALVRKEQLAAVGELSAVIAHEVRNPLAILKNAVSGLRQKALGAEDRKVLLGIVNEETDRLGRLVRDLLAYARPMSPTRAPTKLRELVELACRDGRLEKVRGQTEVQIDIAPERVVVVDRAHAHHAIVNVVDNALAATGGHGLVRIRAIDASLGERPGVAIEVCDSGAGMDEQVLAKARDPFFTTRPAGTGLGLAIVDRVMRGHDGALELESRLGEGTVARLVFPVIELRAPERASATPPAPVPALAPSL
jgi:signal transduction histidine kinase